MKGHMRSAACGALVALASCAGVPTGPGPTASPSVRHVIAVTDPALIARFAPRPATDRTIDYEVIDEALDLIVFRSGPSLRRRERRPDPSLGSNLRRGHDSPYRLEGNKVFFSQFDDDTRASLSEYRRSLEAIAASGQVQALAKNEQLAFWFNLHNLVVVDEVAKLYPTAAPSRRRIGPNAEPFHDADIVDLGDAAMSLRDVREVVYAHWSDPKVIYGFYRGDLGGPQVRPEAYKGADVSGDLDKQASEFVGSLRGVLGRGDTLYVSELYREARPHYFADWSTALEAHLLAYTDDDVAKDVRGASEVRYAAYEDDIADMAGGYVMSDIGPGGSFLPPGPGGSPAQNTRAALEQKGRVRFGNRFPPGMARMIAEYEEKLIELRQRGYLRGTVVIVDVPTDDPADAEVE